MKHYKELLLAKLINSDWKLLERDEDTQWWLEETWRIRSIKQRWGFELLVLFLVDPMHEGRGKSRPVWAVSAFEKMPEQRPVGEGIATLQLQKGRFDAKIATFVAAINAHRNAVGS
jgi:hypothetical protein